LRKDYDSAIKICKKAVKMNPFFNHSYWHLAKAYYVAGRDDEAALATKAALLLNYDIKDIRIIEDLVVRYVETKEYHLVIKLLKKAITVKPEEPTLFGRMAMAYAVIDDKEKAREYIQKVAQMDPSYKEHVALFLEKLEKGELADKEWVEKFLNSQ
jgi:tetratricopeptide (TPR) repeat protein